MKQDCGNIRNVLMVMVRQNDTSEPAWDRWQATCALLAPCVAFGLSFNIDLDVLFGPPQVGNGAPSASFGGAAEQPGLWNRLPSVNGGPPIPLAGLDGVQTAATTLYETTSPSGTTGVNFPGNTGDYGSRFL